MDEAQLFEHLLRARKQRQVDGLTEVDWLILHALKIVHHRPGQLARRLGISASEVTRSLNRMVDDGLITIERDHQDRRAEVVTITTKGRVTHDRCFAAVMKRRTAVQESTNGR